MSSAGARALFALVESFFTEYLRRQRGASDHTVRAYRDALKLLFEFVAQHRSCDVASLEPKDLDAEMIAAFLDHLETAFDDDGLCLSPMLQHCDYLFVTPSHQCPTNATLSMERRVALLE